MRSSATAEDGVDHAWAGQLDSYLNTTEEILLKHVQHCWASLFTPRAIFYRFEKGLHDEHISVAVVVQVMVNSEASGVAFSVHPVTEDRNQIIIEAGFGLGEAIVSGQITPDSYVVEKEPRRIIDISTNTQIKALHRAEIGGNVWQDIVEPKASSQVLSEEQIGELSDIIMRIEQRYGFPCDIEWAFEDGKFYIVQSRPITTLLQITQTQIIDAVTLYLQDIDVTHITKQEGNFSLLIFMSLLPECFSPYISRYYTFDFDKFLFVGKQKYGILFFSMKKYLETSRVSFNHFLASKEDDFKEMNDYVLAKDTIQNMYTDIDICSLTEQSEEEIICNIQKAYDLYWSVLSSTIFSEAVYKDLVIELYNKIGGTDEEFSEFFSMASLLSFESFSLRFDTQLLTYIEEKKIQDTLWIFADYYDAPDEHKFLLEAKKTIVAKGGKEKIKEEVERIRQELPNITQQQLLYYQTLSPKLQKLFDYMQLSMEVRDSRKDPLQRVITLISFLAKAICTKRNIPLELVPFAMYQDFFDALYTDTNYIDILKQRQNCVVFYTEEGPQFEFSDPDLAIRKIYTALAVDTVNSKEIKGNSASKGNTSGTVKVVLSESDFKKFQSGDILVTSMTRPEFVPLMKMAKAVITDEGGITCHAAIISRELGLPCIIGTAMATRLLNDGDIVQVDANAGIITILHKYEQNISGSDTIELSKIFSREKPLLYFSMWNDCDRIGFKKFLDYDLKHNIYIVPPRGSKGSVWYDEQELAVVETLVKQKLGSVNSPNYRALMETLEAEWTHILPYIDDTQLINTADEFPQYYDHLVAWWSAMTTAYEVPNFDDIDPVVKESIVRWRVASETYTEKMSRVMVEFVERIFPEYAHLSYYISPAEVAQLVRESNPDQWSILEKRKEGIFMLDGHIHLLHEKDRVLQEAGIVLKELVVQEDAPISGVSACKGMVTGTVRVIKSVSELARVEAGDVLVTDMTTPDYIASMKLASAVVTDEGGLTCHAAITCREFSIPCVVGTKIATKVLKDGDIVEVDANTGIVTKRTQ